ncbi:SGNH/GDSL hydrolase family protein [Microlunatus speluncae]|uniref:SGNH/GDSL hydrolase family protein n=1 Tax=Microlunatus speluncae TaxID=2594267 RepID=UPI0012660B9F|nr:SGNH/GDSL hydrolase family protein [Microlunatus speluncae]
MGSEVLIILGDSYSSGVGAGDYLDDGTDCLRSRNCYGAVIGREREVDVLLAACSGALTSDLPGQLDSVQTGLPAEAEPAAVALTIGGNDAGFARVLSEAAKPWWWGDSAEEIAASLRFITDELPARLATTLALIESRFGRSVDRVLAGYPHLFAGTDCHLATFFTAEEMYGLNDAADKLAERQAAVADAAGWTFVDVRLAFAGHATCTDDPWIHNVDLLDQSESFHPTMDGQRAYADAVGPALPSLPRVPVVAASPRSTVTCVPGVASDPYRGRVRIPDLGSADARAAALRHNIPEATLRRLQAGQRNGAHNRQLLRLDSDR